AIVDAIVVEPGKIRVIGKNDNFEKNLRSHAAGRGPVRSSDRKWWGKQDSNLRRHSQRIYSPPPLPLGTFPRPRLIGSKSFWPENHLAPLGSLSCRATGVGGLMVRRLLPVN